MAHDVPQVGLVVMLLALCKQKAAYERRISDWSSDVCSSDMRKLFGKIGQDTDALGTGVDHEVDGATLAIEVKSAVIVEDGRRVREDAAIGPPGGNGHEAIL